VRAKKSEDGKMIIVIEFVMLTVIRFYKIEGTIQMPMHNISCHHYKHLISETPHNHRNYASTHFFIEAATFL
jgi:hypothetical protein